MMRLVAARIGLLCACGCAGAQAQVAVMGRAVDETGAGVAGARIEFRQGEALSAVASSDAAGNFNAVLPAPGEYDVRAERLGFFLMESRSQRFEAGSNQLTITLNHQQEFSERIDVVASPPAIDPQQTSDRKELHNAEIQAVPYPAPQDYRNALALMNGVVQDNAGRVHVNGGDTNQTNYKLDGFNISEPATGRLETRMNIDAIQSVELNTSRFSPDNGRGSAGVLEVKTKMGDDRWRFGGANFVPGISSDTGFHINKWTPRLEVSGPLARGRAWFHNGLDAFYSLDVVHGLPPGQDRTRGLSGSDLTRFQVNITPANILTAGFLANVADNTFYGLSILNPPEATSTHRQRMYMTTVRDQQYVNGALLEVGFADTRSGLRDTPQGGSLYQITPFGNRGNYFVNMDRHAYRQQFLADLFLPTFRLRGEHQLKAGIDFERESFHQEVLRHPYEVLRADASVARYVEFAGSPFQARKNFEGAYYIQDRWIPGKGLAFEAGLRAEWNEIFRDLEIAPRLAASWAPRGLADTRFSAGWGVYYDAVSLSLLARAQDQVSMSTYFPAGAAAYGPVETAFRLGSQSLRTPYYRMASAGVERKLPLGFYGRADYVRRSGERGLGFASAPASSAPSQTTAVYDLRNLRQDRYDGFDVSVRRTFAGQYEWFAGYVRSSSRTNAAVDYSLESPIYAPQASGPLPWDAPGRFHTWGWMPLPEKRLPERLRFVMRNSTLACLLEYRTGFPFAVVDEQGVMVGPPGSRRLPSYFNVNLHLERKFRAIHYLWAWRFGYTNLTNNGNPNTVNNVMGTPQFLTYGRGQVRAFSVRLRLLGRK